MCIYITVHIPISRQNKIIWKVLFKYSRDKNIVFDYNYCLLLHQTHKHHAILLVLIVNLTFGIITQMRQIRHTTIRHNIGLSNKYITAYNEDKISSTIIGIKITTIQDGILNFNNYFALHYILTP